MRPSRTASSKDDSLLAGVDLRSGGAGERLVQDALLEDVHAVVLDLQQQARRYEHGRFDIWPQPLLD
jgi:hypothetical protein